MNNKQIAQLLIKDYYEKFSGKNFYLSEINAGAYNFNFDIQKENDKIKLIVFYGKNGVKVRLQGSENSNLFNELSRDLNNKETKAIQLELNFSSEEPESYIGVDESGKGDFFGPLIIAGFFLNEENRKDLLSLKVNDSKTLSDKRIKDIAEELKSRFKDYYDIVVIKPSKYNELYEKDGIKNLNKLLGWAHARVIENILTKIEQKHKCEIAICDKFGNESFIKNALMEKGKRISLIQTTKAEKFIAVAAASILARNEVINWFNETKGKLGFELPKGSGTSVRDTARKLVEKFGEESLKEFAKIHFKISNEL